MVFLLSKDGNTALILDATEEMTYARNASLSNNMLQNGVNVADHYHSSLPSVTFSGIISSSKMVEGVSPTPTNYRILIEELIDTSTVFTLYGTDDESIPTLEDCVITDFQLVKDVTNLDSLQVVLNVQQIDFGMRATLDTLTVVKVPSKDIVGGADGKKETKAGTSTLITEVDGYTLTQAAAEELNKPQVPEI